MTDITCSCGRSYRIRPGQDRTLRCHFCGALVSSGAGKSESGAGPPRDSPAGPAPSVPAEEAPPARTTGRGRRVRSAAADQEAASARKDEKALLVLLPLLAAILTWTYVIHRVPPRHELLELRGQVQWVSDIPASGGYKGRGSRRRLEMAFKQGPLTVSMEHPDDRLDAVYGALGRAAEKHAPVTLLVRQRSEKYAWLFEARTDEGLVLSYDQGAAGHRGNMRPVPYVIVISLGIWLALVVSRVRKLRRAGVEGAGSPEASAGADHR